MSDRLSLGSGPYHFFASNSFKEVLTANVVVGVLMRGHVDRPPDLGRSLRLAARYEVETDDEYEYEDCAI